MSVVKVLSGHYSAETAYVIDDYPCGFVARCKKKIWLEIHPKKGTRMVSQTTNPKKTNQFDITANKPKYSTYCQVGALFIDHDGYVQWNGLSIYDASKAREFLATYGEGLTEDQRKHCKFIADAYDQYEAAKKARDNPTYSLQKEITVSDVLHAELDEEEKDSNVQL